MSDIAIKVENISKRYRIGLKEELHDTFFGALASWVKYPLSNFRRVQKLSKFSGDGESEDIIWALRDVSFEVKHGEVLGIIGKNGAGKSTLLKILCRITEPTSGNASIHGRVASLLEVGTGFHQELTGRENVFLNGAILGMTKIEIERKFDEIVDFSGVEKFIDTPVKRYSSGMRVRLAFAVAAHLEPEILLIDEVLAVGDVEFQKKCLGKMKDVAGEGRTILFVSHNMGAISMLCEKTMLLSEGKLEYNGPTEKTIGKYLSGYRGEEVTEREWSLEDAPGSDKTKLKRVAVTSLDGSKQYLPTDKPIVVNMEYWVLTNNIPISIGIWLHDEKGNEIFATNNYKEKGSVEPKKPGLYSSEVRITANLLNVGKYTITPVISANINERQLRIDHCLTFDTSVDRRSYSFESVGIIKPECEWSTKIISVNK